MFLVVIMKTLSSLASSSSKAMFSASLTAKDFTMAGLEVDRDLLPPDIIFSNLVHRYLWLLTEMQRYLGLYCVYYRNGRNF